jgi:hypothetical protein
MRNDNKLTCEFTNETLAGAHVADDSTAGDALHDVAAVPGDQVAVVNDVLFAFTELSQEVDVSHIVLGFPAVLKHCLQLTSLRRIAPMLCNQQRPVPVSLYTNRPSPEKMALLSVCAW